MMSVLELFCAVDDFCQSFEPVWTRQMLRGGGRKRTRRRRLALSESMTILILFHQSHYRDFKAFSTAQVRQHLHREFPGLVRYTRFVEFFPSALLPLCVYLHASLGRCTGISFVDSTPLVVCHNRRIHQQRVFRGRAARGKNAIGWFFGFKLHLLFNDGGELLDRALTPGNVDDRAPVPQCAKHLFGKLVGDKGYLSPPLTKQLLEAFGVKLLTPHRKNMQQVALPEADRLHLRKRAIVETMIDQLKNISQIEHTRHRSPVNFVINVVCGLIAYGHQPKKPTLQPDAAVSLSLA